MSEDPLIAIFKLGQKAHMEELLNKGHVFMNTIAYFSSLEEASPRSDPDEGTRYCQNADGAILQMQNEGQWQTVGTMAGAMRFHDKDLESANLYCLHTRRRREVWDCI